MFRIDDPTASPTLPAPAAAGTPGYFTDGDIAHGVAPTIVTADFLNAVMLELANIVTAAGMTLSKTDNSQVSKAIGAIIEAKAGNYAIDTGVANAYVIALSPAITSYSQNFAFTFRAVHANTGASTINFGPGVVPLERDDGSDLQSGDIYANGIIAGIFDAALGKALVSSIVPSQLGALAKLSIGSGLGNDGVGNLQVVLGQGLQFDGSGNVTLKLGDATLALDSGGLRVSGIQVGTNTPISYFMGQI